jgi:hypothetical protein
MIERHREHRERLTDLEVDGGTDSVTITAAHKVFLFYVLPPPWKQEAPGKGPSHELHFPFDTNIA